MRTLEEQLRIAFRQSGLTLRALEGRLRERGLVLDRRTLGRKLIRDTRKGRRRTVRFHLDEAEIFAQVFGTPLVYVPDDDARAS
jgi:hypothetical protein